MRAKGIGSPNGQAGAVTVHITGTGDPAVFAKGCVRHHVGARAVPGAAAAEPNRL